MNTININQLKDIVNYFIDNNNKLTENGKRKISMNIQGDAGLGKTTLLQEIAEERGMLYNKLNLSMLEELGDLVGVPLKEFKMIKQSTGEEKWVAEKLLDEFNTLGYHICEDCESRMSYSIPSWVPKDDTPCMMVLDDFSRAQPMFMNAIMELIDRGEYLSWRLPVNCHLFLTSNYDNGEYSVTSSLDEAQKT